jgi:4-alpha-glucanotransferase
MSSESFGQLLDRAASLCGIDPGYWDIWGRYHPTAPEVKRAILSSMGLDTSSPERLQKSLHARESAEWVRLLPACLVVSESAARDFFLNIASDSLDEPVKISLRCEDGSSEEFELDPRLLPQTDSAELDGRTWLRKLARTPDALPLGYHDIEARQGAAAAVMRFIVAPDRAWEHPQLARGGRAAGVAVSLYGLRSARNWGCGDFRDLLDVIEWVARYLEGSFVALNPLHAIYNRRPFNTSPYLPNCTFYQNFIYLDVEGIEDFAHCRRAQRLWQSPEIVQEVEELRRAGFVEYERVSSLKMRFLRLLFARFLCDEYRKDSPRAREFRGFVEREGDLLERFATYCALDHWLHRRNPDLWVWPEWPPEYHHPESPAVDAFRKKHWRAVLFHQYIQWHIDGQLEHAQTRARQQLSIGLYHDLALATDRSGSDLWAARPFYVSGCRVGSPPDDFSPAGQDWGFPPPCSDRHREAGYRLFAESIRKNCRHGGALRIDHVMRLFRLFWIPEGFPAVDGVYVRERYEDLVRVLALESIRNRVIIVGEDLGTVEPVVRETMARFGILSYRLFYFEKNERNEFQPPSEYPVQAVVSSTTHDLPTLAGFWKGSDIEARRRVGLLNDADYAAQMEMRLGEKQKMLDVLSAIGMLPESVPRFARDVSELTGDLHNAIVGFLALTPSQLLCVNEDDLTKETEQQNLPGTTWQHPNWSRKMGFSVEELKSNRTAADYTAMFRNWIVRTGRRNTM